MNKVGVGFIGAGMIGQLAHIRSFTSLSDCEAAGLAELRPILGREAASLFKIPKVYPDHQQLLCDPHIDAVVVVTRRQATGAIVLDALRAGKHVLSEKPMAHSINQANRLVIAAKENNKIYSIGYMKRHDIGVARAHALLSQYRQSGELGKIIFMRCYCFGGDIGVSDKGYTMTSEARPDGLDVWSLAPNWLPKPLRNDYAQFLNVNIHMLNLIRYFTGSMPRVSSVDLSHDNGRLVTLDFDTYSAVIEFGEVAYSEWHEGIEIFFEKGSLHVCLPPPLAEGHCAKVTISDRSGTKTIINNKHSEWAFLRQAKSFLDDISEKKVPICSGEDSLLDIKLAEEIWQMYVDKR